MKASLVKLLLNCYPPYLGSGIWVQHISADFREIVVRMSLRWYNRNAVGTHFGGSLYAMTDPFYMLMLLEILGRKFIVWDKKASIDFLRPGRGRVSAHFSLNDGILTEIHQQTANGEKYLPQFTIPITDDSGKLVAQVHKVLYIRRKERNP